MISHVDPKANFCRPYLVLAFFLLSLALPLLNQYHTNTGRQRGTESERERKRKRGGQNIKPVISTSTYHKTSRGCARNRDPVCRGAFPWRKGQEGISGTAGHDGYLTRSEGCEYNQNERAIISFSCSASAPA